MIAESIQILFSEGGILGMMDDKNDEQIVKMIVDKSSLTEYLLERNKERLVECYLRAYLKPTSNYEAYIEQKHKRGGQISEAQTLGNLAASKAVRKYRTLAFKAYGYVFPKKPRSKAVRKNERVPSESSSSSLLAQNCKKSVADLDDEEEDVEVEVEEEEETEKVEVEEEEVAPVDNCIRLGPSGFIYPERPFTGVLTVNQEADNAICNQMTLVDQDHASDSDGSSTNSTNGQERRKKRTLIMVNYIYNYFDEENCSCDKLIDRTCDVIEGVVEKFTKNHASMGKKIKNRMIKKFRE